jgi:eukaryotic-like serine/threonine-protein kinase
MDQYIFFDPKQQESYKLQAPILTTEGLQVELTEWKGRGGNASVFSCVDVSTGEELAIKFLMKMSQKSEQRFDREALLMRELQSEHAIRYRGEGSVLTQELRRNSRTTREINIPFILMDLAEYDLSKMMQNRRNGLAYEQYAGQFRGLAGALAELHERAIHRDIKPENILIIGDRWLLSDYGLCTFVDEDEIELTHIDEIVGPKYWFSPEAHNRRIKCGDEITRASDVYQLAAIFWYAATGRHPSGIVTINDWSGSIPLFEVLSESLKHDCQLRPQDGSAMLNALTAALES